MANFIGRQAELKQLREFTEKKTASFILLRGRRRIGKSRLIKEFSQYFDNYYSFIGLAPTEQTTAQHQLDEFSRQLSREFNTAPANYDDWSHAFWAIGERIKQGRTLLFFDEISWMGSKDPTFLSKIKNLWDLHLKENDKLIFVICGSASSWIDKNILSSTGFVGRISYTLTLDELPLGDCDKFWPNNISIYEKLKLLAVTGGIPKYLEEINTKRSAEANIKRLCFIKGGFLVDEFEKIFTDIFLRNSDFYKYIVSSLANGPKTQEEILQSIDHSHHGRISEYLSELELAGFVTRYYTWDIKSGLDSKLSKYYLTDNYLRFYLKYIEKNLSKINRRAFAFKSLASLPGWQSIMGLQFENLILNNRDLIIKQLNIAPNDIICDSPYFQRETKRAKGCQIDYMIQTKYNTLYICEIKFKNAPIGCSVIDELEEKIANLTKPRNFSYRSVLIHANGISDELIERDYFAAIIDVAELLK